MKSPRPLLAVAILALAWQGCGFTFAERATVAIAAPVHDENPPPPEPPAEPEPQPELTFEIVGPDKFEPGTFNLLKVATNGKLVNIGWTVDGDRDPRHVMRGANSTEVIVTFPDGEHEAVAFGTVDGKPVMDRLALNFGPEPPPEPDKPLPSLVTKEQAAELTLFYRAVLATVPKVETPDSFWRVHDAKLDGLGLADSEYATVVAKRFEAAIGRGAGKLDGLKLVAALEAVVKELGAPVQPPPVVVDPTKPLAATYVYEKDDTAIPTGVSTGLNRLNREKNVRATLFEEDTVDGDGDVPDQYAVPLSAARQAGLPSLVVTAGSDVLAVVKDPRTEQQVFEAIAP